MGDLVRRSVAGEVGLNDPALEARGLQVRLLDPARLYLVTDGPVLAPNESRQGEPSWLWLAPDRSLAVCNEPLARVEGRFVTDVSDGVAVFAISGARLNDIVAMGCTLDPLTLTPGRCAQTVFAGLRALLQPEDEACRFYLDRPFAAYFLKWLTRAATSLPTAPA